MAGLLAKPSHVAAMLNRLLKPQLSPPAGRDLCVLSSAPCFLPAMCGMLAPCEASGAGSPHIWMLRAAGACSSERGWLLGGKAPLHCTAAVADPDAGRHMRAWSDGSAICLWLLSGNDVLHGCAAAAETDALVSVGACFEGKASPGPLCRSTAGTDVCAC